MEQVDRAVRRLVYTHFARTGRAMSRAELATALDRPLAWVDAHLAALSDERALVLDDAGEIAKALPFSAVPTPFVVRAGGVTYWGNCAWDAFGLAAMLGPSAAIDLRCGCCGEAIELDGDTRVHLSVPAAMWWEDIFDT